MKRGLAYAAALAVAVSCTERATAPRMRPNSAPDDAVVPATDDYVLTPVGYYHRSCVHEIATGDFVERGDVVRRKDGTRYQIPPCQYPIYRSRRPVTKGHVAVPDVHGWVEDGSMVVPGYSLGEAWRSLAANWVVPTVPPDGYSQANKVYYTFPGLQNSEGNFTTILQPVISYGNNGDYGGSYWSMASWQCGHLCYHSPPQSIQTGDAIHGTVTASNCGGGSCDWTITTEDVTTAHSTTWLGSSSDDYIYAVGGAVEAYELVKCGEFPPNGVSYTNISVSDEIGSVTANWSELFTEPDTIPLQCGYGVSTTSTEVDLFHNPSPPALPLSASIVGPDQVAAGINGTWSIYFDNAGDPPYTYEWSGVLSGAASSITGSPASSGDLILNIWDSAGHHFTTAQYITVCDDGGRGC